MAQQRKQVTVLFINIDSLSAIAQQVGSSSLSNDLWQRLDRLIQEHGGQANRPVSDNTIAIFGAPTAHEDDPERAVQAALDMQASLAEFTENYRLAGRLKMRIGLSTGLVLFDTIGVDGTFMAIGDTVNIASSLIRALPQEPLVIAHSTYRHIRGVFDAESLPEVEIPGREQPVEAYRVTQQKPRAFYISSWEIEGVEPRLIGREKELQQLQKTMQLALATRQARAITISGEAGVGKSRLLDEFDNWIELLPQQLFYFRGKARPDLHSVPYGLIRDVFAFRFQIQDSDSAFRVREKLESGISEFLGEEGVQAAHFIGQLLGYDFSSSPYLQGILEDSRQFRTRAFYYLLQLFTAAAGPDDGAFLFLEDIHWADDSSLDLVEYLITALRHAPFLTLSTTRPTFFTQRPSWGKNIPAHVLLELPLLTFEASQEMASDILRKVPDLEPILPRLIAERSEGNPFYIEELIKMLIDDGVITVDDLSWQVALEKLAEVRIPETLTAVLQASLDSLSEDERETLQRAAVVGLVFWDDALNFLAAERRLVDPDGLQEMTAGTLQTLKNKGLIIQHKDTAFADTEEYSFKNTMLHQVTYESVLRRTRRSYHERTAEWLISQWGERAEENAATIAGHYEQAEAAAEAAEWFGRAARQAHETHTFRAALEYYQQGLDLLASHPEATPAQRIPLYGGLAEMLRRHTRYDEALEYLQLMVSEAEATGDQQAQARAWNGIARVQDALAHYQEALTAAEKYYELVSAPGKDSEPQDRVAQADALNRRAWSRSGWATSMKRWPWPNKAWLSVRS
jgi:predicted ATPase/class 3 adenylate cyclase